MPRQPAPTVLKVLSGTRPSRVNLEEPAPPHARPVAPGHLDAEAIAEWDRIVPVLDGMRVLTVADGAALAVYCVAHSRKLKAMSALEEYGVVIATDLGGVKANPAAAIVKACDDTILKVLASFGCDPSSRSGLKVEPAKPRDRLAELMSRKAK